MALRPRVIRLGVPSLLVAGLALVALWRIGLPPADTSVAGPGAPQNAASGDTLTRIADVLAANAIGRQASLERVAVTQMASARAFWLDTGREDAVFAVLDPDATNSGPAPLAPGARVAVIGLVRPAPKADVAARQWKLDAATAQKVADGGTYLQVTEVRPVAAP